MSELLRRLDDRFEPHAVCLRQSGACLALVKERAASIVEFRTTGFHRPATWGQMNAFARWCRATGIEIVHTCDFYANVFGLPAAALAAVPVRIGSRRELNPDKSAARIVLQRLSYTAAHRIVANSSAAARRLRREGVAASKIRLIPNGIALDRFVEPAPPDDRLRIITVANLRREKAHEVLIDAAARLRAKHPRVEFLIVGDGPRRAELEAMARTRGLAASLSFLGQRDDVPALLASSHVFVLPSRSEASPNSVIEAMASGLPVVAAAAGGLLEIIDQERTGLLVHPDDLPGFVRAIDRLLTDRELAQRIGRSARTSIAARYSFDRMVHAFEDLYVSELRHRSARPAQIEEGDAPVRVG
jgi:glycosyltransferase involved in cell wall biosynthesis